ncbi:type III secretion protein [Castellaniella sp. WN]
MKVFDELLTIKRFREERAELAVMKQRRALADAERCRVRALESLDEYRNWSLSRERGLYGDLCARLVHVRDIEDVMRSVASLRQGERDHEARVDEAAERERLEAETLDQRRETHREASRQVEKFMRVVGRYEAEQSLELERRDDLEMEEIAAVARDRDDWSRHDDYEPERS